MTLLRAIAYTFGAVGSLALMGQFWAAKSLLARLFAVYLLVGATNCVFLLSLLLLTLLGHTLPWGLLFRTLNAVLIGFTPLVLFFVWAEIGRKNGGHDV